MEAMHRSLMADGLIRPNSGLLTNSPATQFSQSVLVRLSPSLLRSNGMMRSPSERRCARLSSLAGLPQTSTLPAEKTESPARTRISVA